ncbi:MAG: germination protein YpeB [Clostridiales bacterium]|nr:germination protein YpeB [Clostridiales bacterium]
MKRTLPYLLLGVLSLTLLIALNASQRRTATAELALNEGIRSAVAEAASELETLTLSLEKLLVTTSTRQKTQLLSQLVLSADRAQTSLAALPDHQGQQAAVLAYLSRLSHLAQTYLSDLAEGDLPSEAHADLSDMLGGLQLLQAEMTLARQDVFTGGDPEALPMSEVTAPPSAQELRGYKALPSREIGSGEAMQLAKEFVGNERVTAVSQAPNTAGALPAFGVTVQTADVQLNLEVTRRGGKVLLMAPETASFPMTKTPEQCSAAALNFLQSRGFAQMEAPYYQVYDGLCVLTCVYVQNGVLIWPDRVLVQVRMDTAEVVGIEARSYWRNHIPRKLQTPLLTRSEAQASLSPGTQVDAARLCLLPSDGQERLCWQFTLTQEGETYISYIDAMTGQELLLEKVMQLEFGAVPA